MKYRSKKKTDSNQDRVVVYANDKIKAFTIMVIDEEWSNLWEFSRDRALEMASEMWKDLVQLSYNRDKRVSTAKMVDLWKHLYEKKKKDKEKRKSQKVHVTKELVIGYMTSEHDSSLKENQARGFLKEWNEVKFLIKLKWRQWSYKEKAQEKLLAVKDALLDVGKVLTPRPAEERNWYSIMIKPLKQ